jgi:hypothetical protein
MSAEGESSRSVPTGKHELELQTGRQIRDDPALQDMTVSATFSNDAVADCPAAHERGEGYSNQK